MIRRRRGFVSIEVAIIAIAFIVVAAAIAFIALSVGFTAQQRAGGTFARGLAESSSSLMLAGSVQAKTDANGYVKYIVIPVRVSAGREPVDLSGDTMVVRIWVSGESILANIYKGVDHNVAANQSLDAIIQALWPTDPANAEAKIVINNDDGDRVLDYFEQAYIIINFGNQTGNIGGFYRGEDYDSVKVEIVPVTGASLIVDRTLPGGLPISDFVDLG